MNGYKKLGRNSAHRKSMLRNLVTDLFREGRITTTLDRAKEAGREAEKLVTLAKRGDLHARRQVLAYVFDEDVVTKLFDEIAPEYAERNGGYTRVLKLGPRQGDNAEVVYLELVQSCRLIDIIIIKGSPKGGLFLHTKYLYKKELHIIIVLRERTCTIIDTNGFR